MIVPKKFVMILCVCVAASIACLMVCALVIHEDSYNLTLNALRLEKSTAGTNYSLLTSLPSEGKPKDITNIEPEQVCFSREDYIYVMDVAKGSLTRLVKGEHPALSPSGDRIAFSLPEKSGDHFRSTIKLLELRTGAVTQLPSLNGVIAYRPEWSPDGKRIAFQNKIGIWWGVGVFDIATAGWKRVSNPLPHDSNLFLSSWSPDSKSILCQNLEYLFELDIDGRELQRIPLAQIVPNSASVSGLTRFSFSRNKRQLLFDTAASPETNRMIYLFDLEKRTLTPVLPSSIDGSEPHWLPSEKEILFLSMAKKGTEFSYSICRISLGQDSVATLINDVSNISYSPY